MLFKNPNEGNKIKTRKQKIGRYFYAVKDIRGIYSLFTVRKTHFHFQKGDTEERKEYKFTFTITKTKVMSNSFSD